MSRDVSGPCFLHLRTIEIQKSNTVEADLHSVKWGKRVLQGVAADPYSVNSINVGDFIGEIRSSETWFLKPA